MGGERSSSIRMRLAGKTCALCRTPLPPPHQPGERFCARCDAGKKSAHRVYMAFQTQSGWHCRTSPVKARCNGWSMKSDSIQF